MGRYFVTTNVSKLKWGNIKFESDISPFVFSFEIRKNSQFRQGNLVLVAATKDDICPLKLLIKLKDMDPNGGYDSSPIFFGFNGRLVAKNPQKRYLLNVPIKYTQYVRYLSPWFDEVLGISAQEFKDQYGSQSGRSGDKYIH